MVTKGAGAYGGLQISVSNATTPNDLAGDALDYGYGGGAGWGLGLDDSVGSGTDGRIIGQATLTGGLAAGGIGHGFGPTKTTVTPICSY